MVIRSTHDRRLQTRSPLRKAKRQSRRKRRRWCGLRDRTKNSIWLQPPEGEQPYDDQQQDPQYDPDYMPSGDDPTPAPRPDQADVYVRICSQKCIWLFFLYRTNTTAPNRRQSPTAIKRLLQLTKRRVAHARFCNSLLQHLCPVSVENVELSRVMVSVNLLVQNARNYSCFLYWRR